MNSPSRSVERQSIEPWPQRRARGQEDKGDAAQQLCMKLTICERLQDSDVRCETSGQLKRPFDQARAHQIHETVYSGIPYGILSKFEYTIRYCVI